MELEKEKRPKNKTIPKRQKTKLRDTTVNYMQLIFKEPGKKIYRQRRTELLARTQ